MMETSLNALIDSSADDASSNSRASIAMLDRIFARPAHLLYAICAAELVITVLLALGFGFRTANPIAFLPHFYCFLLIICGPLCRRIDKPRLGGACETVGFLFGQGFALVALLYPMTAVSRPFADAQLAAVDRVLGFDWVAFAQFVGSSPTATKILEVTYYSFALQGAIILPTLFLIRKPARAWTMIFASNFSLLATLLIYPLFPAQGTFIHYGIAPSDYPNMTARVAWAFGPAIHAIRDGGARLITPELMVPFVSFPSYHAVAAVLFIWAAWPIKLLRWPFALLNACMAVAAIIIGAHFLIDVIAGAALALASIAVTTRVIRKTI